MGIRFLIKPSFMLQTVSSASYCVTTFYCWAWAWYQPDDFRCFRWLMHSEKVSKEVKFKQPSDQDFTRLCKRTKISYERGTCSVMVFITYRCCTLSKMEVKEMQVDPTGTWTFLSKSDLKKFLAVVYGAVLFCCGGKKRDLVMCRSIVLC